MVCGIASNLTDFASGVMSSQCVYIGKSIQQIVLGFLFDIDFASSAGMSVEDTGQRDAVLKLLENCRARTGWPVKPLGDELSLIWQRFDKSLE